MKMTYYGPEGLLSLCSMTNSYVGGVGGKCCEYPNNKIIVANSGYPCYASHCSKHLTYVNSFNPHITP